MAFEIFPRSKLLLPRLKLHSLVVAFMLATIVCVLADRPSVATSYEKIVLGVESIEVSIHIDADEPVKDLVDAAQLRERVLDHITNSLRDNRPDISVQVMPARGIPERKRLDPGTLAIALTLAMRTRIANSVDLPCCFGAMAMRIDRDAIRRERTDELIYSDDFYRMNWPPEPVFLGNERGFAVDRAAEVSAALLDRVLITLNHIPPRN